MSIEIKYIQLSFINTDEEILKQIKNTVLFSYLFQTFEETTLVQYLESTQYGYTASASEKGTHQLVRITDINSGKVDWSTVPFCNCEAEGKYLLQDGDILVARTGGTTGKSFVVNSAPKKAIFASYLIRLRLKKQVNLEFINLYLNSYIFWSQIVEMKSGSAMPNVNAEKLKTLRIPKLSFEEQNEFVQAFKNVEKGNNLNFVFDKISEVESFFINSKEIINELDQQLDLIKQLRQAFLSEAMQGKLVKSSNTTETGKQLLAQIKAEKARLVVEKKIKKEKELPSIKNDDIPFKIPEHWTWCRLGEIISYSENLDIHKNLSENTLINYVDIASIDNKSYTIKEVKKSEVSKLSTRARRVLKKDYIIYSTVRPYLKNIAIIDYELTNFIGSTGFNVFKPIKSNLKFLFYFFLNPYLNRKYEEMMVGFNSPSITNTQFENTLFPLPSLYEQEQIVTKLEELMTFCDGLENSIKKSKDYNYMLLQQILREALQPQKKVKIIPIENRKIENPLKTILAGHIINLNNTTDFGRVKFQKLLFLTEYICKIDFDSNYIKKVAGPYDDALIKNIEADFNRMRFFSVVQDKTDKKRVRYTALAGAKELENLFLENFPDESVKINNTLLKFRPLSWGECELIATLYAVWNNRIIKNEPITDELLYNDFMDWDQQKKKYHSVFHKWLFWMKDEKIIPDGWGKYIDKPN